jgi:RHS repeat-associated protein
MAKANPFRFSAKYQDDETELLYYGYRYYSASTGRWLSRDPLGERGGINLLGLGQEDVVNGIDSLGLCEIGSIRNAKCNIMVTPEGASPDGRAGAAGMAVTASVTEIAAWIYEGAIAGAATEKEAEQLAEAAGLLFDKGGQTPSVPEWIEYITTLWPKLATARGYNVFTRIVYEQCESRCAISALAHWIAGSETTYWDQQPKPKDTGTWLRVGDKGAIGASFFDSSAAAVKAGQQRCRGQLKEFLETHFINEHAF